MTIYILYFFILFTISYGWKNSLNKTGAILAIIIWLFIGLRSTSVGEDTLSYISHFRYYGGLGFNGIMQEMQEKSEPLYVFIMWIISLFSSSFSVMLLVWALFPAIALYQTMKRELKYSSDYTISYLAFFILGFFVFFTAGIRQTATISLVLYGYKYMKEPIKKNILKDQNTWRYLFLLGIGYYIHNSILIMALVYPLKFFMQNMRIKWWYIIIALMLFFVAKVIQISQLQVITQFLFQDKYQQYGNTYESSWTASAFIMQLILFLMCYVVRNKLSIKDKSNTLLLNLVLIGLFFQSMSGVLAEMARVSYYFSIFYVILLPRAIRILTGNGKNNIVTVSFIVLSLIYLIFLSSSNLPNYSFAWE